MLFGTVGRSFLFSMRNRACEVDGTSREAKDTGAAQGRCCRGHHEAVWATKTYTRVKEIFILVKSDLLRDGLYGHLKMLAPPPAAASSSSSSATCQGAEKARGVW